jgi:hypothetical protein
MDAAATARGCQVYGSTVKCNRRAGYGQLAGVLDGELNQDRICLILANSGSEGSLSGFIRVTLERPHRPCRER